MPLSLRSVKRWSDPLLWAALLAGPALCWVIAWLPGIGWSPGQALRAENAAITLGLLIVVYPILEECLFRGNLQPWLGQQLSGGLGRLSWANLVTSVLFTALHFVFHPPLWAAAVFVPSLVFGFFRERHQRLDTAILLHASYNASYALLLGG